MILNIRAWHQLPRPRAIVMCNEQGEATAQTYNPVVNKNRLWNAPAATRTTFRFSGSMIVGVQRGSLSPKPSCTRHRGNAEQSLQLADTWALGTTLPSLPRELHTCPRRPQPQVYTVPASLNAMECSSPVTTCRMRMGLDGPREMTACNHAKATKTLTQPQSREPTRQRKRHSSHRRQVASSHTLSRFEPKRLTQVKHTTQPTASPNDNTLQRSTNAPGCQPDRHMHRDQLTSTTRGRRSPAMTPWPHWPLHDHIITAKQRSVTNSNRGDTCTSGSA